jgi:hypothetical protein
MEFEFIDKPSLIEPTVKHYLNETLKQCHIVKTNFHNTVLNIGLFVLFVLVVGLILFFKYKGQIPEEERRQQDIEKQKLILEKIKMVQEHNKKAHQDLITGLPALIPM